MTKKLICFYNRLKARDNAYPNRIEDYASILVLLLLLADVALQIVTRYLFNHPVGWTEEIARYLLIVLTFVGGPIAVRNNSNVSLDFLLTNASPRVKKIMGTATDLIELIFYVLGTYLSWRMTAFSVNRYLVTVRISRSVIYGLITLSFVMMTVRCVIRLIRRLREAGKKAGKEEI